MKPRHILLGIAVVGNILTSAFPLYCQLSETKIHASDASAQSHFGRATGIYGDYVIIGAQTENNREGSAYIFKREGEDWIEEQKLTDPNGSTDDQFGRSVAIYGDYAIVGSFLDDDGSADAGSAFIYRREGTTWIQEAKLQASDASGNDRFGTSVGISADYAVVGAYLEDSQGSDAGAAYVFARTGSDWNEVAKITASDGATSDNYGFSSSISGERIVVGAWQADNGTGSAYIYELENNVWVEKNILQASDGTTGDQLGSWFISIDNDYAIVGALGADAPLDNSGAAYIFHRDVAGVWSQQAKLTASDGLTGDEFGVSVSISGDYALVGTFEGSNAYIFKREGGSWNELYSFTSSDFQNGDDFAYACAIQGNYAVVGADDDGDFGSSSGSAYLFTGFISNPMVLDIPDQTIIAGDAFEIITLDDFVDDEDFNDADISWTVSGNTNLQVTIDVNRVATITYPVDWTGSETLEFTATNPLNSSNSNLAVFSVLTAGGQPPVVADIPDQSVAFGAPFATISLDDFVDDLDNADSVIVWSTGGNTDLQVSIDADRIATITYPVDWSGSETITFTGTDPDDLSDSDDATFTVNPDGEENAPVVTGILDAEITGTFVQINLDNFVEDADHADSEITWSFSGNIDLTLQYNAVRRIVRVSAPDGWSGSESITFTATDPDGLSGSDDATFTVAGTNAPAVSDIPDQSILSEEVFTTISLDDFVSDADHADSEITWTVSGNTDLQVSIDLNRVASITYPVDWTGSETIVFTGTDPEDLSGSDGATFTVVPIGGENPPMISDIPDATITGAFVQINLDNFVEDADHADSEITWSFSGNIDLILQYNSVRRIVRVSAPDGWSGSETITFTATDPGGLQDNENAIFTVDALTSTVLRRTQNDIQWTGSNLEFIISHQGLVEFAVFDYTGKLVYIEPKQFNESGTDRYVWDVTNSSGRQVPEGVYFIKINSANSYKSYKIYLSY